MRSLRLKTTTILAMLALALSGCCSGYPPETVSTTKATWYGQVGTAVTITQSRGTKQFENAKRVGFEFCQWKSSGDKFWEIADFSVPVMKLEPATVTLFFSTDSQEAQMLVHIPSEFRNGKARLVRCLTSGDC
jgi:hypothetical protein